MINTNAGSANHDDKRSTVLADYGQAMLDEASRLWNEHPDMRVVGLIVERGALLADHLVDHLSLGATEFGFVGVIPRWAALDLIAMVWLEGLEWLPDEGGEPVRRLPVLTWFVDGIGTTAIRFTKQPEVP